MKSWLIQRGTFKTKDTRTKRIDGIDSLISFDYMGSAEFEWGALPKALNRMIENWNDYIVVGTGIRDKRKRELFILCNKNKEQETIECVTHVSKNAYGYKEWCDMGWALGTVESKLFDPRNHNEFWWDIQNDWMACVSSDRIKQVKYSIEQVVKERKQTA